MEAILRLIGTFLLDHTERSAVIVLVLVTLILHLVGSYYRTRSREVTKSKVFGSTPFDILRAGFSILLFITGVRILGTVFTIETCGRLSTDDFIVFGTVGTFTCLILGAIEIRGALFGRSAARKS